jgi:hypothetical protein
MDSQGLSATVLAPLLIVASAAIIGVLGLLHLVYTFHGPKLLPRDPALKARMEEVSPVITRETTLWKTWIGFNASHSYGALLYALVYGYLAAMHPGTLFDSAFLLCVGALYLAGMVFIGRRYFFSIPYRGILLATGLYAAGLIVRWA